MQKAQEEDRDRGQEKKYLPMGKLKLIITVRDCSLAFVLEFIRRTNLNTKTRSTAELFSDGVCLELQKCIYLPFYPSGCLFTTL